MRSKFLFLYRVFVLCCIVHLLIMIDVHNNSMEALRWMYVHLAALAVGIITLIWVLVVGLRQVLKARKGQQDPQWTKDLAVRFYSLPVIIVVMIIVTMLLGH